MTLTVDKLGPSAASIANPAPSSFTIDQLAISPLNVRFDEQACEKVEALSASIVAEGLLQPLVVHPVPKGAKWARPSSSSGAVGQKTAQYGVLAGGRRYRAIKRAIEDGALPADFAIHATVRDLPDGEIILLSLSENLVRLDLEIFEKCRAVARAHAEGLSVDAIAAHTGQSKRWVGQHLRLGDLHPDIFAAYIAGDLSLDQASAFAATEDRDLQAEAWAHFKPLAAWESKPDHIRAWLKVGDRELARNLLFVGEAIYRGNGGRFELDLFADGPDSMRGRVIDEELLSKLVTEKMEVIRGQVRAAWAELELRFQAQPPQQAHVGIADRELEVTPRKTSWETARIPRKADPADFVATIEVDQEGGWIARLWWASRKAKAAFEKSGGGTSADDESPAPREGGAFITGSAHEADARRIVRSGHGLTADGINVVRSIRRDILRALLLTAAASDSEAVGQPTGMALAGDVPRDYLTWAALSNALLREPDHRTGARGIEAESWLAADREPRELMEGQREEQDATAIWTDALALLQAHPAFEKGSADAAAAGLRSYLAAEPGFKRLAEAVLAGLALVRSAETPGWRIPAHDVLAEAIGGTPEHVRRFWRPTAAFTGLFGKLARQEMVQPFVDEATRRALAKAKDRDLSARTAELLAGQPEWLHPLLRFGPPRTGEGDHPQDGGGAQAASETREPELAR